MKRRAACPRAFLERREHIRGEIILEVDISEKAHAVIKYGLAALLLVAFLCAGGVWWYQSGRRTLTLVEAEVAGHVVQARALAAGTVTEILVGDGEPVKQGQALAKLKVKVSPEQIQQLESNLALSRRNLEELQAGVVTVQPVFGGGSGADVDAARMRYEKTQFLFDMGAVSAHERDAAEAAYQEALSGGVSYQTVTRPGSPEAISRAEIQVRQAEAALASAQQASGATELFAPVDGIMYLTEVKEGSDVHAGEPVFRIGATGEMWVDAYASKEYADLFHIGQAAYYTLNGHDFLASVAEIYEMPEAQQKDTTAAGTEGAQSEDLHAGKLRIRVSIPDKEGVVIRPAMRTTVKVLLDR